MLCVLVLAVLVGVAVLMLVLVLLVRVVVAAAVATMLVTVLVAMLAAVGRGLRVAVLGLRMARVVVPVLGLELRRLLGEGRFQPRQDLRLRHLDDRFKDLVRARVRVRVRFRVRVRVRGSLDHCLEDLHARGTGGTGGGGLVVSGGGLVVW